MRTWVPSVARCAIGRRVVSPPGNRWWTSVWWRSHSSAEFGSDVAPPLIHSRRWVHVAPPGRGAAAGEHASAVARLDRSADVRGHQAQAAADVQRRPGGAHPDPGDLPVAGDPAGPGGGSDRAEPHLRGTGVRARVGEVLDPGPIRCSESSRSDQVRHMNPPRGCLSTEAARHSAWAVEGIAPGQFIGSAASPRMRKGPRPGVRGDGEAGQFVVRPVGATVATSPGGLRSGARPLPVPWQP